MSVPSFEPSRVPRHLPPCRPPRARPRRDDGPSLISVASATSDTQITELLLDEPFAFLSLAAEALSHPSRLPPVELIERLLGQGSTEAVAMARALTWLTDDTDDTDHRLSDNPRSSVCLPPWLSALDQGRILAARWRRERPNKTSYLLRIELPGNREGTMQARIDHDQGGALTNAWFTDEAMDTIESLITTLTRHQQHRYGDVVTSIAANALARGVELSDGARISSPTVNRWPGLRPLVEFALTTWSIR